MNRTHWILIVILAIQLALLLVVFTGGDDRSAGEPRLFLETLSESQPVQIVIADSAGESISISRQEDGWVLDGYQGFPADEGRVFNLLDKFGSLRVKRPVVRNSRYHSALKVTEDDHEKKISIWNESENDPAFEIYFGTSPNYRIHHVRRADDDLVFEESEIGSYDLATDPGSWMDRKFVTVPPSAVTTGVKLRNAHGEFGLRLVDGAWITDALPASPGGEPDQEKIESWILSIIDMQPVEPGNPVDAGEGGFTRPVAELELTYGTETIRIFIGEEIPEGDGKRFALREGSDFSVILGKWETDKIAEKMIEDLI